MALFDKDNIRQAGPAITPKTLTAAGQGGQAQPPYLQAMAGQPAKPIITPKASAPGDTMAKAAPPAPNPAMAAPQAPPITPAGQGKPPQAGGQTLGDVYKFFQSDLQNQRNQALASTRADASARGVFYGTPLTGSEADINTQYLRGLGQLQAGMYGNEQQNELARLGLAGSMGWQNLAAQPPAPGPMDFSGLGAAFGASPAVGGPRQGPTITPAMTKQGGKLAEPKQGPV